MLFRSADPTATAGIDTAEAADDITIAGIAEVFADTEISAGTAAKEENSPRCCPEDAGYRIRAKS